MTPEKIAAMNAICKSLEACGFDPMDGVVICTDDGAITMRFAEVMSVANQAAIERELKRRLSPPYHLRAIVFGEAQAPPAFTSYAGEAERLGAEVERLVKR